MRGNMGSIGWFGADVIDFAGGIVGGAVDVAGDVLEEIPMAPELYDALTSVVTGPMRDFAKTDFGMTVFRAMSTMLHGAAAVYLGPQVAALAFATPGLVRGEDFWTAWMKELAWRAEKTAEYFLPMASEALTPAIQSAADKLTAMIPYEDLSAMASEELASRLNTSEWVAEMGAAVIGLIPIPNADDFDIITGKRIARNGVPITARSSGTLGLRKRPGTSAPSSGPTKNACEVARDAEAMGQSMTIVRALRAKCYAAQEAGEIDQYGYTIPAELRAGAASSPVAVSAEEPTPRNGVGSDIALGLLIGGAGLALLMWARH